MRAGTAEDRYGLYFLNSRDLAKKAREGDEEAREFMAKPHRHNLLVGQGPMSLAGQGIR